MASLTNSVLWTTSALNCITALPTHVHCTLHHSQNKRYTEVERYRTRWRHQSTSRTCVHLHWQLKGRATCQAQADGDISSNDGPAKTSEEDWWLKNDASIRSAPLVAGAGGGFLVVLNRALSGVAPVADAGSSQSRADVLCLALAATLVLTGLVWKSLQAKQPVTVALSGIDCLAVEPSLPPAAQQELCWAWDSLRSATRCRSLVVVYGETTCLQAGKARESATSPVTSAPVDPQTLLRGSICSTVQKSGRANYIANLALFPGRFELSFLPSNTQAVIVQPLGDNGVMLLAADTIRGFGPVDQAWIATLAQKLDSSLQDWYEPTSGSE